jgi:RNA polymerase sigma-70 factor (ECF subfamily)
MQADAVAAALAQAHRSEWAFLLSATVRVAGDLDVAEECGQEAYVSALQAWTWDGVPERPGAWLATAARNKALNRLRREVTLRRKLPLLVEPATVDPLSTPGRGSFLDSPESFPPCPASPTGTATRRPLGVLPDFPRMCFVVLARWF